MTEMLRDYAFNNWLVRGHPINVMLDGMKATAERLYDDTELVAVLAKLQGVFTDKRECLSHRDLHTGAVMVNGADVKVGCTYTVTCHITLR